jgi:hypothetical protein
MENNPGRRAATLEPQQKHFVLSEGATETLGATLFLMIIGGMGYNFYTWIWSLTH